MTATSDGSLLALVPRPSAVSRSTTTPQPTPSELSVARCSQTSRWLSTVPSSGVSSTIRPLPSSISGGMPARSGASTSAARRRQHSLQLAWPAPWRPWKEVGLPRRQHPQPGLPRTDPPQRSWSNRKGSLNTWSAGSPTQEARLLPQLGAHLHLQVLPLLQVPPHPQVCLPQGYHTEQGVLHLQHRHSL